MFKPETCWNLDDILFMDVETDNLRGYTTIHCIVAEDLEGNVTEIIQPTENANEKARLFQLLEDHSGCTVLGHNFLSFDYLALGKFFPGLVKEDQILDSLVVARLLNFSIPGGNSLEAWGQRLGFKKAHSDLKDFSKFTPELLVRCKSDVRINAMLYKKKLRRFITDPEWQPSIWLEHKVASTCRDMSTTGLHYDKEKAIVLRRRIEDAIRPIDRDIERDFEPKQIHIKSFTPRLTKKGTLNAQDFRWATIREFTVLREDTDGIHILLGPPREGSIPDLSCFRPYTDVHLYDLEYFNPGSIKQIVQRMNEAGWKPTEKTKGHIDALKDRSISPDRLAYFQEFGWKVSEENLKTLPETAPPAARRLAQRIILASRLSDLDEWLSKVTPEGKVHPEFSSIGAWTHRVSHSSPNSANMPVAKRSPKDTDFEKFINDINDEMRACVIAPKGKVLVGTDADGIQMRIFAHLTGDQNLIEALIKGKKEDETDIHSLNRKALGTDLCKSRDVAKTYIYAWLLGAGTGKVAEILETSFAKAKAAVSNFLETYPGLKELKQKRIPREAEQGYFIGLDGRKVVCNSEHLMLSGHLQNGEKVIMSLAEQLWRRDLEEAGIEYSLVNWVHDEWQTLVDDDPDVIKTTQEIQKDSIRRAGELLGLRCPLAGTSAYGHNWKETH